MFLVGVGVIASLVFVFVQIAKIKNYFKDRGVPYVPSISIFGSSPGTFLIRHSALTWTDIYYQLAPHKVGGFFDLFLKRYYMVRDPEYVQLIFTTHFDHFTDRGFHVDLQKDPMDPNIFFLNGSSWKALRNKISPIFTPNRLKWLYDELDQSANRLLVHLWETLPENVDVDIRDSLATFSLDAIVSTVFGYENTRLEDLNDSPFREVTTKFFEPNVKNSLRMFLRLNNPEILKFFKVKTIEPFINDFFLKVVRDVFKRRSETKYHRKDVIQLLLELKQKGWISVEESDDNEKKTSGEPAELESSKLELTDEVLAAQAFVLYMAGFETTMLTLYALTYFISINTNVQAKLRQEILEVKEETSRIIIRCAQRHEIFGFVHTGLLPPLTMTFRECTKDFTFPNGVTVLKGQNVIIPHYSMQMDPDYYPDPTKFIPERFNNPVKGTYYPFGEGQRQCIGKRFAELEMKLAISRILQKYRFEPSDRDSTANVIAKWGIKPNSIIMYPRNGLLVKMKKICNNL